MIDSDLHINTTVNKPEKFRIPQSWKDKLKLMKCLILSSIITLSKKARSIPTRNRSNSS